jgi:thiol-disulfide isomerase/thioredoxin
MRKRIFWAAFLILLGVLPCQTISLTTLDAVQPVFAQDSGGNTAGSPYVGTVPAPEFPTGLDWINVTQPLTMAQLKGKAVLLDFWTYGCINCIHMIPVLQKLEQKYPDELVVIGVHSAKFANEGDTPNIRQIVRRYGLDHPVINDNKFIVWQTYGAQAWPTFVLIDPAGKVVAIQPGEIPYDLLDRVIGEMLAYFDGQGKLNRDPIQQIKLDAEGKPDTALAYPGKILADPAGNRLFISDSSHNRIVIADLKTYEVLDAIGSGQPGLNDGDFAKATFNKPQGMALGGTMLYVADTENHAIRAVDLNAKFVKTIAGTGNPGTTPAPFRIPILTPTQFDLRSPWDVAIGDPSVLYVAMAGAHQIWSLSLTQNSMTPIIGSGQEGLENAAFPDAQLAQPSGLYYQGGLLYIADPESSSIRVADIVKGEVRLVAGPPMNDLFQFGDKDGKAGDSRLQHALGITGSPDGLIYVADTYNSKIKVIDPATTQMTTLFGLGGDGGFRDGAADVAQFDEPGGLSYADGKLYVADTNNDAIRVIDLAAKTVSTITFPNADKLQIAGQTTVIGGNSAQGMTITLPEQSAAQGSSEIVLKLSLPDGYKINDLIDSQATFSDAGGVVGIDDKDKSTLIKDTEIHVPVTLKAGSSTLDTDLTLYYCREGDQSLCFIDSVLIEAPLTVGTSGDKAITIVHEVTPPQLPAGNGL